MYINVICFRNAHNIKQSRWQHNNVGFDTDYLKQSYNQNMYSQDMLSRKDQLNNLLDAFRKQKKKMHF